MPPLRLPTQNLAPMILSGLVFQACASGPFAFAGAAWLCLLPLLVLMRCVPLWQATALGFLVVGVARLASASALWGVGAEAVVAAAVIAGLTLVVLLSHRLVMRELPLVGAFAAPAALIVVETAAEQFQLPGATLLPLSSLQSADVPLWRFVDVLTPVGISAAVCWGQSVMAGFGEAWLAPDPASQLERERGLRVGANAAFWLLAVGGHLGGLLRDDPTTTTTTTTTMTTATATHGPIIAGVAGLVWVVLIGAALASRSRVSPSPVRSPA
jgi:hypothetical protein